MTLLHGVGRGSQTRTGLTSAFVAAKKYFLDVRQILVASGMENGDLLPFPATRWDLRSSPNPAISSTGFPDATHHHAAAR